MGNFFLLRALITIGFDIPVPHLYGDNLGSLFWSTNLVQEKRSKHIDIQYHYVRDTIENDKIKLYHIDGTRNPADILTKNLGQILFVTNFIWPYLHQFSIDSHGLNGYRKPLKRPFDRYQSRLEAINNGRDIRQINW